MRLIVNNRIVSLILSICLHNLREKRWGKPITSFDWGCIFWLYWQLKNIFDISQLAPLLITVDSIWTLIPHMRLTLFQKIFTQSNFHADKFSRAIMRNLELCEIEPKLIPDIWLGISRLHQNLNFCMI